MAFFDRLVFKTFSAVIVFSTNHSNIFTPKGDDPDKLDSILASFPPVFITFGDPLSQIQTSEMIFSGRFKIEIKG
jgi:hypothetical protein